MTPRERFMRRVVKMPDGCWLWTGSRSGTSTPYGRFSLNGRRIQAHRFSYEEFVGPIPAGLDVHHRCEVPLCVNPEHLLPLSHAENVRLGTRASAEMCPNGHAYTQENTLIQPNGRRSCRSCRRERVRKFRAR